MQDLNSKVRAALAAYLTRGQDALVALQGQRIEEFFAIMASRDAAFHNFRALDAQTVSGPAESELKELWRQIDQVNRTLKGLMLETQADLGQRVRRVRGSRAGTQAYHSGTRPSLRLVKQI